jgi:nitrate/nitrite-specific signal transduction histidine kinase
MHYSITQTELTCINILIKVLQEAINRNCFDEEEIKNILKTINKLTKSSNFAD